jgi:hypothetical protein
MSDLVERLRDHRPGLTHGTCMDCHATVMDEAADEIERLASDGATMALHLHAMLELYGKPKRDEWLSDKAWEHAVIITENAKMALGRVLTREEAG